MLPGEEDHVAKEAANQPRLSADGPTYENLADEWWPATQRDIRIYKKDVDDGLLSIADSSSRLGQRADLQPTVRRGPAKLRFRLGKRSSTNLQA